MKKRKMLKITQDPVERKKLRVNSLSEKKILRHLNSYLNTISFIIDITRKVIMHCSIRGNALILVVIVTTSRLYLTLGIIIVIDWSPWTRDLISLVIIIIFIYRLCVNINRTHVTTNDSINYNVVFFLFQVWKL